MFRATGPKKERGLMFGVGEWRDGENARITWRTLFKLYTSWPRQPSNSDIRNSNRGTKLGESLRI